MTFEETTNPKKYVRILDSTYAPFKKTIALIGKECEVLCENYQDNTVQVAGADRGYLWFNRSDVQFLTPLEFKGRKIGIGDRVKDEDGDWFRVYGYSWADGAWLLDTFVKENLNDCWVLRENEIVDVRPLSPHNTLSDDELLKELERRGRVKDGKMIV